MTVFDKHPAFIVRQASPFNGGPPLDLLRRHMLTPAELFFVRNHGNVPEVNPASFRLEVGGAVERPLALSLGDLATRFSRATVIATLQCAGNRRQELAELLPIPGEVPWGPEAVSTAQWTGVRLADVLADAGVEEGAGHVEFIGLDQTERHGHQVSFGGSVPLTKAVTGDVLLAWEMNGALLPPTHGFPLRVVVPGYIGARSVKWLHRIVVRRDPSDNYFQRLAYRLFPPDVTAASVDWETGRMLGDLAVNSIITSPVDGSVLAPGRGRIDGLAVTGAGREIVRVDVSADGGLTWHAAGLAPSQGPWAWRFWNAELPLTGRHEVVARATDSQGDTQPEDRRPLWNFKGYMNNAWPRIRINATG